MVKSPTDLLFPGEPCRFALQAIERFLASQLGMMGSSAAEGAQVDQLGETVRDIKAGGEVVSIFQDDPLVIYCLVLWNIKKKLLPY